MAFEEDRKPKQFDFRRAKDTQPVSVDTESENKPAQPEEKRYRVGTVSVLIAYAAVFLMMFILRLLDRGGAFEKVPQTGLYILYGVFTVLMYGVPGIVYTVFRRKNGGSVRVFTASSPHTAVFAFVTGLLVLMTGMLYRFYMIRQFSVPVTDDLIISMETGDSPLFLLLFGVLPAMMTEYFFRGVLQGELTRIGGGITGILIGALASALCVSDARLFPEMLLVGLMLALLAHICGSFVPGLVVRIVVHTIAVLFGDRLRFIAAERAGNSFTLILLFALWLIVLIVYLRSASGVCSHKAHRIEAMLTNEKTSDGEEGETPDSDSEDTSAPTVREPTEADLVGLKARLSAPRGYTLHKFLRVALSPVILISAVLFIILALR